MGVDEDLLIVENQHYLSSSHEVDPDGLAVAIVKIGNVRPFTRIDMKAACASSYEEGWLAWEITDVRSFLKPFRVVAARKIYELDIFEENFG